MTKITNFFKTIACIICLTAQINNVSASWPPFGMNGNGTALSPWEITTISQLMDLATFVNAGNGSQTAGIYYKLVNDIVYNPSPIGGGKGWSPIGNNLTGDAIFQGNFDGNGKVVSNIWINRTIESYIGLFGYVSSAHIHDLEVEVYQEVIGNQYVGGLIGEADHSVIENCYAIGNVTGNYAVGGLVGVSYSSAISNSYAICEVNGYTIYGSDNSTVGGLVGMNIGTINTSYADGNITATGGYAGGFAGTNDDIIIDCYAVGDVTGEASHTGGFVGANKDNGTLTYCFATGDVTATGDFIGGLAGENRASLINCVAANNAVTGGNRVNSVAGANAGTLSHNYAYEDMLVNSVPVIGGTQNNVNGESKTISTLKSINFYNTISNWYNNIPWSIDTDDSPLESWGICNGETFPFLQWQWQAVACNPTDLCKEPHAGTFDDPHLICTVQDLVDLANYVNSGGATNGKYWKLMNDLDLVKIINWDPIGNSFSFQGHFDGNGKIISNLTINRGVTNYIGLFGRISNAEIKNLGIEACQITGYECVGALVGFISDISTIENCYVSEGNISGYRIVGGLIGEVDYDSNVTINNCYATGRVTGTLDVVGGLMGRFRFSTISNCYAICEVSGTSAVGGLVGIGSLYGIIDKSYAGGDVQSTSGFIGGFVGCVSDGLNITDCYATGNATVIGTHYSYIGGLVGPLSSDCNIANCYATGNITITGISSYSNIGGLVGSAIVGSITNCYATGNIDIGASDFYIGGLVGSNYCYITNCYATSNITVIGVTNFGGLVGTNFGILTNCVAANASITGGISNINRIAGANYGTLSHNYAYEDMLVNGVTVGGGAHNNANGANEPMSTLKSFNFYNTGSNWYSNNHGTLM